MESIDDPARSIDRRPRRGGRSPTASARGSSGSGSAAWSPPPLTVLAVVAGGWWLLRAPDAADRGRTADRLDAAGSDDRRPGAFHPPRRRPGSSSTSPAPSPGPACTSCRPGRGSTPPSTPPAAPLAEAATGALNLAAPLGDGERVYVPAVGESVPAAAARRPRRAVAGVDRPGPVDLNRATAGRARLAAGDRAGHGRRRSSPTGRRTGRSPPSTTWRRSAASARPSSRRSGRWSSHDGGGAALSRRGRRRR